MQEQDILHYRIEGHLGTGGMGEVYRARDTKLGRSVAIKMLPAAFAQDAQRVARFEREARLLASLNHPNIAALHGLESVDSRHLLVMELVRGETLAERIARGPISVEDALVYARQIAEALEAAHEKGVIHRDLKPANVKITPEGKVKVLDFGLAKAVVDGASDADVMNSPTLSIAATFTGMIMGTAPYMAPEQAKGLATDHRSDIFSFGCVLYEMLTGRVTFQGETTTDVIASVLKSEPDFALLPANLHSRIGELVRRCLAKDPRRRWQSVGDVRVEIESILADPRGVTAVAQPQTIALPLWRRAVPFAGVALAAAMLAGTAVWIWRPAPPAPAARFSIPLPDDQRLTRVGRHNIALSPDGQSLVYVADGQLYLRPLAENDPRPIQGTNQDVNTPFFSPDGQWIAFYSVPEGKLKRIASSGGAPVVIADTSNPFGASWTEDDHILIGQGNEGIGRVSADGGTVETVIKLTAAEVAHGPQLLPDGEHVLFTLAQGSGSKRWDQAQVVVQSLRTGERKVVLTGGSDARYVPTGHLVYALGSSLYAVRFDAAELVTQGGPVSIVRDVTRSSAVNTAAAFFSFSATGSLVYFRGTVVGAAESRTLSIVDGKGSVKALPALPAAYSEPRVSPDGSRLALRVDVDDQQVLWIYDLAGSEAPRRLTFTGDNSFPVWLPPDGKRIAWQGAPESGSAGVFAQASDGSGVAERLTPPEGSQSTGQLSVSSDGGTLLYRDSRGSGDIWQLPLTGERKPQGVIQRPGNQFQPALSPDGKWIAYGSTESGMSQIHVQPFPPTGSQYLVSEVFSRAPLWSADGTRLYYLELNATAGPGRLMSVEVRTSPAFAVVGKPVVVFDGVDVTAGSWPYSLMPDGRFLVVVNKALGSADSPQPEIRAALNFFEELEQRLPAR